jgi:hypothetical protein
MEKFRTEELLECVLTTDELITKGNELSKKTQEVSRLENSAKTTASEYKAKINACTAEIETLSLTISTKVEVRKVKCEIKYNNPIDGQKTIIRVDTGAIHKIEMMNDHEKGDLFINALGEQGDEFIFRDKKSYVIIEQAKLSPDDAKEWQSIGFPASMESLVDAPLEPSQDYRIIKGEDPKGSGFLFQLQKRIVGLEIVKPKKARGKAKKDTMKAEQSLTITADFICDEIENGEVLGCCQCEKDDCSIRNAAFGNAVECTVNLACSENCPRFIK